MVWLTLTLPCSPFVSIHDAVLTVSPQISYWNFLTLTMPATTGPVCMPARISKAGLTCARFTSLRQAIKSCICSAVRTVFRAASSVSTDGVDQAFLSKSLPESYKIVEAAFQVTYYEHIILANGSAHRKFCRLP